VADVKNYTINFGFGRAARLTLAALALACTEIDLPLYRREASDSEAGGQVNG
jgi:hypothetical protein